MSGADQQKKEEKKEGLRDSVQSELLKPDWQELLNAERGRRCLSHQDIINGTGLSRNSVRAILDPTDSKATSLERKIDVAQFLGVSILKEGL